mgnify:CR=1 FL=1
MMMTAATPMMMPSMVSSARILLSIRDLMASLKDWVKFMPAPPLPRPPGAGPRCFLHIYLKFITLCH